jgi:hypothetical protein
MKTTKGNAANYESNSLQCHNNAYLGLFKKVIGSSQSPGADFLAAAMIQFD